MKKNTVSDEIPQTKEFIVWTFLYCKQMQLRKLWCKEESKLKLQRNGSKASKKCSKAHAKIIRVCYDCP